MSTRIISRLPSFIAVALAATAMVIVSVAQAQDPQPPAAPEQPSLTVAPGTTEVTASWRPVSDATSYQVRWRLRDDGFAADRLATVTDPTAAFDVGEQGRWVVRVQACNDAGCGPPGTSSVSVIININGHEAVRTWRDSSGWHLDWDPLPGNYVVKYSINNDGWYASPPQSEVGYTFAFPQPDSDAPRVTLTAMAIQVYFNCDEDGNRCTLLGSLPNTTVHDEPFDPVPSWEYYADDSSRAALDTPIREQDPLTGQIRTDLTVSYETFDDGRTYRCVSRPAENPWERGVYGATVKSCGHSETVDQYKLDFDAVFPDGARCGERKPENEQERSKFGNRVRVCNDFDPIDQPRQTDGTGGVSGRTHLNDHIPNKHHISPAHHLIEDYGRIHTCESEKFRHPTTYHGDTVYVWITARRCYDWGNRVERVRTIASTSGADLPAGAEPFRFCGWETGKSPETPYEVVWEYIHPEGLHPRL